MTRLFLAIPVSLYDYERIKNDFTPLLEGKWRDEEHLHITIAFLGQRFESERVIAMLSGFDVSFVQSELTAFDYFTQSRVFVATSQNPTLQSLYERFKILFNLEANNLNPHVTLMRVKKITDPDMFADRLATLPAESVGILESKVALYQSTLYSDGARYEVLRAWTF